MVMVPDWRHDECVAYWSFVITQSIDTAEKTREKNKIWHSIELELRTRFNYGGCYPHPYSSSTQGTGSL